MLLSTGVKKFNILVTKRPITKRPKTKRPLQQNAQCKKTHNYKTPNVTKRPLQQKAPNPKKRPNSEKKIKIQRSRKKKSKFWKLKGVCIISGLGLVKTVAFL